MIKISERCRKILRTVFRGIGVSVISLILQACYGVMYPDEPGGAYGMPAPAYGPEPPNRETLIYGKVTAKNTGDPIFGIKVSIEETEYNKKTNENGLFYFSLPIQEIYKVKFEDVDGPDNGGLFKEQTWTLKENDTHTNLLVAMDLDTEADEE